MVDKKKGILFLVGGVLIGSLIGAGAALLTAPQSGVQTRTMLRDKGVELKSKVVTGAGETRERATKTLSELKGRAGEMVRNMRKSTSMQPEASLDITDLNASAEGALN
jgi:gas vesicle protein